MDLRTTGPPVQFDSSAIITQTSRHEPEWLQFVFPFTSQIQIPNTGPPRNGSRKLPKSEFAELRNAFGTSFSPHTNERIRPDHETDPKSTTRQLTISSPLLSLPFTACIGIGRNETHSIVIRGSSDRMKANALSRACQDAGFDTAIYL